MHITRRFTKEGKSPYRDFTFRPRASRITSLDGSAVFQAEGVLVPENWDQTAVDVLAQKYFRRKGCDFSNPDSFYSSPYASNAVRFIPPTREFENDLRETIHRIVGCWTSWGEELGYFDATGAQAFYDELSYMMASQKLAPNSPQWFNTGLNFAYGITGTPQGHYYVETRTLPTRHYGMGGPIKELIGVARPSKDAYSRPATSACFIQGVRDDLIGQGGITDLWTREARVFKFGGGSGTNFSKIRGLNEPLSGGGKSSGLMSFLAVNDRAAGAIKSGGTTRRAAKMAVLNIDHPDIETFIQWKVVEERKVAALATGVKAMRACWSGMVEASGNGSDPKTNPALAKVIRTALKAFVPVPFIDQCLKRMEQQDFSLDIEDITLDWEGAGYLTVAGQNANNSVRVTDAFMEVMLEDGDWSLTSRTSGSVMKTVRARDLWDKLVHAAWMVGDPGLQFDDAFNNWHTGASSGRINATNPCSEFAYLDDTACNLGSLNLCAFLNDAGEFNIEDYRHACRLLTLALEITVACSQYPSALLAQNSYDHRPLGAGYANLGALLMRLGVPYDSRDGRDIGASLMALMTAEAYGISAEMAAELGAYPAFELNREHAMRILRNHRAAANNAALEGLNPGIQVFTLDNPKHSLAESLTNLARIAWDRTIAKAEVSGLRNSQVTVLAPTGTIGIVMACDTTGIEPDFSLVKFKKLAGGGYFRMVNASVPSALAHLGYTETQIADIIDHVSGEAIMGGHTDGISKRDLISAGYTDETLQAWDDALRCAFDPSMVLPVEKLVEKFGQSRVEDFLLDVGGRGTVEGARHLKPEHLAIFDCAAKCGRKGTRFISPRGHLKMMAACQPFISGAISKTVNLPASATFDDVNKVYLSAWKWGLKSIALYRDGSKFSQPLATSLATLDGLAEMEDTDEDVPVAVKVQAVAEALTRHTATRFRLPTRRTGYTQAASVGGTKMYLRTGEYDDGSLGEIFLDIHKEGAGYRSLLNAFSIAVSIGLQYGVPLDEFCDAFIFTKFEPNGIVRGHDAVKTATSVIDFVFRDLAISYLDRHDLAHVKPEDFLSGSGPKRPVSRALNFGIEPEGAPTVEMGGDIALKADEGIHPSAAAAPRSAQEIAREHGFTGEPCPECGHLTLVRNGTCNKCQTCGTTTGCS